jgi:hypothetical protein
MDYKLARKYFNSNGSGCLGIVLIVIGAMIFISSLLEKSGTGILIGIIGIAIGAFIIYISKSITDEMYDNMVSKGVLSEIDEKALNKLGIDEDEVKEAKPIYIDGYEFEKATKTKLGKDGLWRSNLYKVIAIYFSANEVHCYTYKVDTLISKQSESTDVYFYNDIVSISTSTDTSNINNVNREYESFVLVTKGGTKLKVAIRNKDEAQRSINAMRSLLRTKKHD